MSLINLVIEDKLPNQVIVDKRKGKERKHKKLGVRALEIYVIPPGGVLLGILGGGVPPGSSNPDPISDLKMPFPTPVFRPDL